MVIGPQQFRDLMAGVCAPVTIVTTVDEGRPFGATVSAFASLSLDPPMVTVALDRGSSLLARILRVGRFGVNVLGNGQDNLAVLFARRGTNRFAAVPWCTDHGLPRLLETASWIACDLARAVEGGDHLLLLGLVTWASRTEAAPLVYGHRVFGTHSGFVSRPIPTPAGASAREPLNSSLKVPLVIRSRTARRLARRMRTPPDFPVAAATAHITCSRIYMFAAASA